MAFGVAGLGVLTDSLSAIKHAAVTPVLDDNTGLCVGFERIGDWPAFGNDDDSVDSIAVKIVTDFHAKLQSRRMYRDAMPTLSVLTITSNVMYGANTGRLKFIFIIVRATRLTSCFVYRVHARRPAFG